MVMVQLLVVAAAFAVTDAVWLKLMNPFYRGRAGELLADKPHLGYAVAFHVMYIAGTVFFGLPLKLTHSGRFPRRAPSSG
jgi:uncharacterized membrane protein